jgi:probable HAF family extracellular repeat protein
MEVKISHVGVTKGCAMTRSPLSRSISHCCPPILGLLAVFACMDGIPPSAPLSTHNASAARSTSGPTVKSTSPDTATVDSTLSVHVFGSGFDAGSRAQWALQGVPSSKIVTNSTQFVSSTELIANISIAPDATLASYDVMVTTSSGKGGIGTELFVITAKTTDLGTLGGPTSEALGVNNYTQVVGWSTVPSGDEHAFLWTKAGGMQDLGTLGGASSRATAINDNGQVVGFALTSAGDRHAFLWTATDGMRDLGTLGGAVSEALAISKNGAIVGGSYVSGGGSEWAFFWSAGVMENLGMNYSRGLGVNSAFQVVATDFSSSPVQTRLWTRSGGAWTSEQLVIPNSSSSVPYAINDLGQVVGGFWPVTGSASGYLWTRADGAKLLPSIPRQDVTWGMALSGTGRIGGYAMNSTGRSAAMWDAVTGGWTGHVLAKPPKGSSVINALNDNYQAVGFAKTPNQHAMLWDLP